MLPVHLRQCHSLEQFKHLLKTFLFSAWGHGALWHLLKLVPYINLLTYLLTYRSLKFRNATLIKKTHETKYKECFIGISPTHILQNINTNWAQRKRSNVLTDIPEGKQNSSWTRLLPSVPGTTFVSSLSCLPASMAAQHSVTDRSPTTTQHWHSTVWYQWRVGQNSSTA